MGKIWEADIYQDKKELLVTHSFSSKYQVCWKSIGSEALFTRTRMNYE